MSLLIQYRLDEASISIGTDSVGSLDMTNTGVTTVSETFGTSSINASYFDGSSYLNLPSASVPVSMTSNNSRAALSTTAFMCLSLVRVGQLTH